ncbi:MAG: ribosome-binding factor A [Candidatus Calescibacterium sp.]|nr:ribosome-binding factor A [Candidatus Calescibacterium sp.]MDW8132628.1 ribosome-binding factor A [Candidatus Calescibacterium sp.]
MKVERIEKIRKLLQREISVYLHSRMNLHNIQINRVLLSSDLKKAKFLFSCLDSNDKCNDMEDFLNRNSNRIRTDLFRLLKIKSVPEFVFEYDRGGYHEFVSD